MIVRGGLTDFTGALGLQRRRKQKGSLVRARSLKTEIWKFSKFI